MLKNITQAYIQSKMKFNCIVRCHQHVELKKRYFESIILYIIKPLYSLIETKNHWFTIYLNYYKEKLGIEILFFNICFFITKDSSENFGIIEL